MNNFIPLFRSPIGSESSRTGHRSYPASVSFTERASIFKPLPAVFLFLFVFSFALPSAFAQTTVFEETFPNSTVQWVSRPDGTNGIWNVQEVSGTGSPLAFGSTICGNGSVDDSAYYAVVKNSFSLISNRTYRISVKCSLATNSGTKEIAMGLCHEASGATRLSSNLILQTGALSTNGWNTFTATFNTTGNLSSWTQAVPVLWANILGTPKTAMVYVDDIKIELLANLPPETVSIDVPLAWALVNSPANIKANATDPDNNIERVKFYSGSTYLGEDLTSPYTFSASLGTGTRSVKAVAIDQYGLSLESASRTFVVNTPPTATSTSPADGAQYGSTGAVSLAATAFDEDFNLIKVEFYVNGQNVGEDYTAPYTFSYTNSSGGEFTWHARAVDDMNLWGLSEDRSFTITAPASTSIISPADQGTVGSCNVYIQAETTYGPGGIRTMNFFRNDTLIGSDSISPYEYKGTGWAAGSYNIEARGVDLSGTDIAGTHIVMNVQAAELVLNLTETNEGCTYRIFGTLPPYQSLTLSSLSNATDGDNNPYYGMELVTGKEEMPWSQVLNFTDFSPVGLSYMLKNPYGCQIEGTFTLHPESKYAPGIEQELVLVSGLKLDPNSNEYYYCAPDAANLVIQPVVANTTGTVWYQALNPGDNGQIYQTFTNSNGTVQITSPMLEEQQLVLNAITPLGCTGGHQLTINFSVRQAPVVTVAPVTVYGNEPALAVAQASGGTGTYSYTWSTGTCLDSSRCDSVMFIPIEQAYVTAIDLNGCTDQKEIKVSKKITGWAWNFRGLNLSAIVAKNNLHGNSIQQNKPISVDGTILLNQNQGTSSIPNAGLAIEYVENAIRNYPGLNSNSLHKLNGGSGSNSNSLYFHNGDLTAQDTIIFGGDSSQRILIVVLGDLVLSKTSKVYLQGIEPNQLFWNVKGKVKLLGFHGDLGYVLSDDSIITHDSLAVKGTLMTKRSIRFECGAKIIEVKSMSFGENTIQAVDDVCIHQVGATTVNLACNNDFQWPAHLVFGPSELNSLTRWFPKPMDYGSITESSTDVFDSEAGSCSNPMSIDCYGVPKNHYSYSEGFFNNQGTPCSDLADLKCRYVGISSYGTQVENIFQKVRPESPTKVGTNYLVRFRAAQADQAKLFPPYLRFLFAYQPEEYPKDMRGIKIKTPELETTNTWNFYNGIIKTEDNLAPVEFGLEGAREELLDPPFSNVTRSNVQGRNLNISYTFIDRLDLFEAPTFLANVEVCIQGQPINLLKNQDFSLQDLNSSIGGYPGASAQLLVYNQSGAQLTNPDISNFTPTQGLQKLVYKLLVDGNTLDLGETNFIWTAPNFSIAIDNSCPNTMRFDVSPAVGNAIFTWQVNNDEYTTTEPFLSIDAIHIGTIDVSCVVTIGSCSHTIPQQNFNHIPPYEIQVTVPSTICAGRYYNFNVENFSNSFNYYFRVDNSAWQVKGGGDYVYVPSSFAGTHVFEIKAISGQCMVQKSVQFNVVNIGEYSLAISPNASYCFGSGGIDAILTRTDAPNPPANVHYIWMVDGTQVGTSDVPTHHFPESVLPTSGMFSVGVVVDIDGCSQSYYQTIYISVENPYQSAPGFSHKIEGLTGPSTVVEAGDEPVPLQVCPGLVLQLKGLSVIGGNPGQTNYLWSGPGIDGWQEGEVKVGLGSLSPGTYTFRVKAKSLFNCESDLRELVVTIKDELNQKDVIPLCESDLESVYLEGYEEEFTFLTKPDQSYSFDVWHTVNQSLTDGRYLIAYAPGTSTGGCVNGEFFILGGLDANLPYKGDITLKGSNFVMRDVEFAGTSIAKTTATITSDAIVYVWGTPVFNDQYAGGTVTGSTIKVKGGADLQVLSGAKITGLCNKMWKGIELEIPSSGSLIAGIKLDGAEIRDAYRGVFTTTLPNSSAQRPYLSIQNSTFSNCYYGLDICAPRSTSILSGNQFNSLHQEMASPFDYIRNKQFYRTGKATTDGLYLTHTGIRFSEPFDLPETNFQSNTFENMAFGVFCDFSSSSLPGFESKIKGQSLFRNCYLASIFVKGCGKVILENNTIELPDNDGLTFKSSFQMDYWGQQYVENPEYPTVIHPWTNPYQTATYTYGIYQNEDCNLANRRISIIGNSIESNASSSLKFHSGIKLNSLDGSDAVLTGNTLINLDYGLFSSHHPGNGRLEIKGNRWIDNGTSIQLAKKTSGANTVYDFTLKCNQFKLNCAEVADVALTDPDPCGAEGIPLRKGLVIGAGVQVSAYDNNDFVVDQIGGSQPINTPNREYPNANEWPVFAHWSGDNRSALPIGGSGEIQTDWWSPVNWTSVSNLSGNSIKYYRYSNEFVQTGSVEDLDVFYTEPLFRVKTQGTTINTSLSYDDACQNLITDDHHIFPTRIAVVDSSDFFTGLKDNKALGGWLGEASPNPAQFETRISVKIPISEELAILQFTEIGTGKVLSSKILSERGSLDVVLDTRQIASGAYLYRVVLKDCILGPKKLIVSK